MVDPRVRKERLTRDFEKMQHIRCAAIEFEAFHPPAPERYEIRFRLRSLLGARGTIPIYSPDNHVHRIEIRLSLAYPERLVNADVRFLSTPIFHPNVFVDGMVCIREFKPSESLNMFVLRLAHYVQCDPIFTGLDSPANGAAKHFFEGHPTLFPTDRTELPSGGPGFRGRRAETQTPVKKAFVVHRQDAPPPAEPKRRFVVSGGPSGGGQ